MSVDGSLGRNTDLQEASLRIGSTMNTVSSREQSKPKKKSTYVQILDKMKGKLSKFGFKTKSKETSLDSRKGHSLTGGEWISSSG